MDSGDSTGSSSSLEEYENEDAEENGVGPAAGMAMAEGLAAVRGGVEERKRDGGGSGSGKGRRGAGGGAAASDLFVVSAESLPPPKRARR